MVIATPGHSDRINQQFKRLSVLSLVHKHMLPSIWDKAVARKGLTASVAPLQGSEFPPVGGKIHSLWNLQVFLRTGQVSLLRFASRCLACEASGGRVCCDAVQQTLL